MPVEADSIKQNEAIMNLKKRIRILNGCKRGLSNYITSVIHKRKNEHYNEAIFSMQK